MRNATISGDGKDGWASEPRSWQDALTVLGHFLERHAYKSECPAWQGDELTPVPVYCIPGEEVPKLDDLARAAQEAMERAGTVPPLDRSRGDNDPRHAAYDVVCHLIEAAVERLSPTVGKYRGEPADLLITPDECLKYFTAAVNAPPVELPPARHSPDFRSVHWFGTEYGFTTTQAAIVQVLWKNWKQGTPDVSDAHLLVEPGVRESSRLVDIFRKSPAWNTMIVSGKTKGTKRLKPLDPA